MVTGKMPFSESPPEERMVMENEKAPVVPEGVTV